MTKITRRRFIQTAALGAAALSLDACSWMRVRGANETIRVAQIGFRSQGAAHIKTLQGIPGVRVVALCDVDGAVLAKKAGELGGGIRTYADIRRLLDDKEIDAVSIATPNHWHALATVWACQAGKDVYIEKPASHNILEGRRMVEAARRYGRMVQCGTQIRSAPGVQQAVQFAQSGALGKPLIARGFCYKARKSIGKTSGPQPVPANLDYDLWLGPAPNDPPRRNGSFGPIHYDWHWFWAYGNGDYGNQAPHQVDVCRWFLGEGRIAPFTISLGGRLGVDDDAQTPNTLCTWIDYPSAPILFEVRGLPVNQAAQQAKWEMDRYRGVSIGCVIEYEHGSIVVPDYSTAIVHDKAGKEIRRFPEDPGEGSGGHHANWIEAVRSRRRKDLNADILEGHISAGLVHAGNISYRLGMQQSPAAIAEAIQDNKALAEAVGRMAIHLGANGVDLARTPATLGLALQFDPRSERFVANPKADALATRNYRSPFVVPDRV